jgi:hypothetical protein
MPTTTPSRAASAAAVHFGSINSSRKRAGLAPLTEAQVAHEFADLDRAPVRTKAVAPRATSNQAAADSMWGSIIQKLNMTVPASRTPVGPSGERSLAADSAKPTQASVDSMWAGLARNLNDEAGLATPARR